jgi:hypothetical protein
MRKRDKKAWLRIVEAFLAILILTVGFLTIISRQSGGDRSEEVYEMQKNILDAISNNDGLRGEIVNPGGVKENNQNVNAYISGLIPKVWNFSTNICDLNSICSQPGDYVESEVYASERIITSTLTNYNPQKLRFFVWME